MSRGLEDRRQDVTEHTSPRRDPQRLFTFAQRKQIAARQHHLCSVCEWILPQVFHVHHVVPWADGGLTRVENGVAVCPECHLRAPILPMPEFQPRAWQEEALPDILALLRAGEFATLNASPGAGKTFFAAWAYRNLAATGDRMRLVVFVPNSHLRGQHAEKFAERGVFLDTGSITERTDRDGVVVTYHVLSDPDAVKQLVQDAAETPTLFVLDEVHHLAIAQGGAAGSWALNTSRIVGTVDRPLHPVLNLSGTLFRSRASERIATIKYQSAGDQIETIAHYSVTAGRLIGERQLRHIKVLCYDADMTVSAVDLAASAHEGAATIRAIDLDGNTRLRSSVLPEMVRDPRFIAGIVAETVDRLAHASIALRRSSVKGLIIADGLDHADQIYAELVSQVGPQRAFVAHGRMGATADNEIRRFRKSQEQAILVAVQKVTEGFDAPDLCVLTYLRTWKAPLFINQMAGRVMRITDREHELGVILPATIIVPNESEVKAAFADVLVGAMQVLAAPPEPCDRCGRDICACPPRPRPQPDTMCRRCGQPWKVCVCTCANCGLTPYTGCVCRPKWRESVPEPTSVDVVGDLELAHVSVDGHNVDRHIIEATKDSLARTGTPQVFVEQIAAAVQQTMEADPMTFLAYLRGGARDDQG